jgi:hypothetical protein
MRVLFAITHLGFLRNFESSLALLAEHGHAVHLVTDRAPAAGVTDGRPITQRRRTFLSASAINCRWILAVRATQTARDSPRLVGCCAEWTW